VPDDFVREFQVALPPVEEQFCLAQLLDSETSKIDGLIAEQEKLIALLKDIVQRHHLPIDSIIGHSDIAPQRKVDPGPLFPWQRLAEAGLIRWPDARQVAALQPGFNQRLPDALWFQQQLAQLGYSIASRGINGVPE
jgi:N-acetyl-anhydromuramyl-L-alanine amidase AmpD